MSKDEIGHYGHGWTFYCGGGVRGGSAALPPVDDMDGLQEWMQGFAAALADYGTTGWDDESNTALYECNSIKAALEECGVTGAELEACLAATETILDTAPEFMRWPQLPVRMLLSTRRCRVCGCTDDDCRQCIAKTSEPCHWVEENLCSACAS